MPQPDRAPAAPARVPPPLTPGATGLATLAVGVVVVAALYFGREVFIPIVLAILLSFVLAPVVNLLRRLRFGRVPSVIAAVLIALGVIVALGTIIGIQVADLAGNLPHYQATIQKKVGGLQEGVLGRANALLQRLNHQVHDASQKAPAAAGTTAAAPAGGRDPEGAAGAGAGARSLAAELAQQLPRRPSSSRSPRSASCSSSRSSSCCSARTCATA